MARHKAAAIFAAACWLWPNPVQAQGRGQTTPLGGRSALLGGTGVAAGSDAAAPLLNPAGILAVDAGLLSFSTRFIRIGARRFEQFRQVGVAPTTSAQVADPDVTNVTFAALPSGTCYFGRILAGPADEDPKPHKLSFCIYQSEQDETSAQGGLATIDAGTQSALFTTSVHSQWRRNHFGVGWAMPLSKTVAIGISSFVVQTSMERTDVAARVQSSSLSGDSYLHSLSGSSFQFVNRIGFTLAGGRYLTLGASLRAPGLSMLRSGQLITSRTSTNGNVLLEAGDAAFSAPLPGRMALGLAFHNVKTHLELNAFFSLPGPMATFEPEEKTLYISNEEPLPQLARRRSEHSRASANLAFGVEHYFDDSVAILAGVSTHFSSLVPRRPLSQSQLFPSRRHGLHASLGMGASGSLGRILAGARLEHLYGELLVPNTSGSATLVDDSEWAITFIFSGQIRVTAALRSARDLILGSSETQPPATLRPLAGRTLR